MDLESVTIHLLRSRSDEQNGVSDVRIERGQKSAQEPEEKGTRPACPARDERAVSRGTVDGLPCKVTTRPREATPTRKRVG